MTTVIDGDSVRQDVTAIDDTDSPYTTTGEDKILVDTTGGPVTVELATVDVTADPEASVLILDEGKNASSNNITVTTEGSATINPGALSSATLTVDGTWIDLQSNGTDWFADLAPEVSSLTAGTVTTNTSLTDASSNTITDFVGNQLTLSSGAVDVQTDPFTASAIDNQNYIEPQATASASSSYDADLSTANYHKVTMTGDVTFDFTNADSTDVNSLVLHLVQDGTGSRTPSFTPTVVWDGGTPPEWSAAANAEDVVTFIHDQDGSQWVALVGGLSLA